MKWLNILAVTFFVSVGSVMAAEMNLRGMPAPNSFVSEGVYMSSATNGVSGTLVISSHTAIFYSLFISSRGSADATVDIYNSITTGTGRKLVDTINCGPVNPIDTNPIFNIYASSGITVVKSGTVPCKATIIWRGY